MTLTSEHDDLVRTPMSWEEYLALDGATPGEYYGGALVVSPPPTVGHQRIVFELQMAIHATLATGTTVTQSAGWSPGSVREELIPDLLVHAITDRQRNVDTRALLVVEVLSTNRRDDMVAKLNRYAQWGAPGYWIVDPRDHVVLTHRLEDGYFVETGRFARGTAHLVYGEVTVPVNIDDLLR